MVRWKAGAFLKKMTRRDCRPFFSGSPVSAAAGSACRMAMTGTARPRQKPKRPPIAPQQNFGTKPKHTTGQPAAPKITQTDHTGSPRGPKPVRHGMIKEFGRFGRKMAQSSAKCPLRTNAHRRAPPKLDIGGLRRMQIARGITLCLPNQDIIAMTDRIARSARCTYDG